MKQRDSFNKSVVEAVHATLLADDKKLRLNICAIKRCLKGGDVHFVRCCPGAA